MSEDEATSEATSRRRHLPPPVRHTIIYLLVVVCAALAGVLLAVALALPSADDALDAALRQAGDTLTPDDEAAPDAS